MAVVNSGVNQDCLFVFCCYIFSSIKLSMPKRIDSEMTESVLEALFFKRKRKGEILQYKI